jgi:hypothetical protein
VFTFASGLCSRCSSYMDLKQTAFRPALPRRKVGKGVKFLLSQINATVVALSASSGLSPSNK